MKMKLGKMGIFVLLLLSLLLSALGVNAYETFVTREGMVSDETSTEEMTQQENASMPTADQVNGYNTESVNSNTSTYAYTSQPYSGTASPPANYSSTSNTSTNINTPYSSSSSSSSPSSYTNTPPPSGGSSSGGSSSGGSSSGGSSSGGSSSGGSSSGGSSSSGSSSSGSSSSDYGEGEGMYALKSSMVPPVCPKCPDAASCPRPKPCPACPPCARCPEPAFECKKVPSYQGGPYPGLPRPILNDFSQFGM